MFDISSTCLRLKGEKRGGPVRMSWISSSYGLAVNSAITRSRRGASCLTSIPPAASGRRSRTTTWAARSRVRHPSHRVGASGPAVSNRSAMRSRSRLAWVDMTVSLRPATRRAHLSPSHPAGPGGRRGARPARVTSLWTHAVPARPARHNGPHDQHVPAQPARPRDRRAPQADPRRPPARHRPAVRHRRGADAGLDGRRGAAPHPHHRPLHLLVPQPRRVLGQGRHLRPRPVGAVGRPGLRRRHPAGQGRPGRRRLPRRGPHLLRRRRAAAGRRSPRPRLRSVGSAVMDLETFRKLATDRRVIPVTRKLLADGDTPVALYRKLAAERPGTFLLESAEQGRSWSRYSFVGVRSAATLTERDGRAHWQGTPPVGVPVEGDPLAALRATLQTLHTPRDLADDLGVPPFTGGMVGYLGYDVVRRLEKVGA